MRTERSYMVYLRTYHPTRSDTFETVSVFLLVHKCRHQNVAALSLVQSPRSPVLSTSPRKGCAFPPLHGETLSHIKSINHQHLQDDYKIKVCLALKVLLPQQNQPRGSLRNCLRPGLPECVRGVLWPGPELHE